MFDGRRLVLLVNRDLLLNLLSWRPVLRDRIQRHSVEMLWHLRFIITICIHELILESLAVLNLTLPVNLFLQLADAEPVHQVDGVVYVVTEVDLWVGRLRHLLRGVHVRIHRIGADTLLNQRHVL